MAKMGEENMFSLKLRTEFSVILNQAIDNGYVICIPSERSLNGVEYTPEFIQVHMLKPSPYVEYLFMNMAGFNVKIKDGEIKAHTGYQNKFVVTILKEENTHDEEGRCYKQITISAPLDDTAEKYSLLPPEPIYKFHSPKEYIGFLKFALEESQAAVMFADAFILYFNRSYIPFKEFKSDCYSKVRTSLTDMKAICQKIEELQDWVTKHTTYIWEMVESYILTEIYDKLFNAMVQFDAEDTQAFQSNQEYFRPWSYEKFHIPEDIEGFTFPDTTQLFSSINDFQTPWEKLMILPKIAKSIDKEVLGLLQRVDPVKAEKWEMSADIYFPILTYFFIMADIPNLLSNLNYMMEFGIVPLGASECGYHLTTIHAVLEGIKRMAEEAKEPQPNPEEIPESTAPSRVIKKMTKQPTGKDSKNVIYLNLDKEKEAN